MTYDDSDCLVVVDGNNVTLRSHHAFRGLTTVSEWDSGALYGNLAALASIFKELRPTHMIWCFDKGRSEFRTELLPTYKAHRFEANDRHVKYAGDDTRSLKEILAPQYAAFSDFLGIRGIREWSVKGWEADDLIAAIVAKAKNRMPVFIVSGDHDMEQLVVAEKDSRVTIYKPNLPKGQDRYFTPDKAREKYGVGPEMLSQLFALVGDKSDNIIGMKGIGPKTAAKWLHKYGDLPAVLEQEEKVTAEDRKRVSTNFFLMDLSQPGIEFKEAISTLRIPSRFSSWEFDDLLRTWEVGSLTADDFGGAR